jgi:putative glycosyltransferase
MKLSVVTTLFQSSPYIQEFYRRTCAAAEQITTDYELIFVNDGSPDDSLQIAIALHENDPRVRVIDLSRNFGHHQAMMTGLSYARGEMVFLIDSDLEEDPALLARFHEEFVDSQADVVFGVQETRKGSVFERMTGTIYYKLYNSLSNYPVPTNLLTVRLMSQRYVCNLVSHRERKTALSGLWAITGFQQVPLAVKKRAKGSSAYGLRSRFAVFVDAITSFSDKPLILIFYLGCFIVLVAGAAATYLIVRRLLFGVLLAGWPSLIVSVWLLGGLTIFCVGLIGIYLSKVFIETKQRPYTVIRKIYEDSAGAIGGRNSQDSR